MASVPTRQRLALGVVTYNNSAAHLRRLIRSIDLAAGRLDTARYDAVLLTIDCGKPAEWSPAGIRGRQLAPRGNLGFGGGMNLLLADAFADPQVSWFLCVNPDGLLHAELLVEMIQTAESYPDSLVEARQFPEEHPKPYDPHTGQTLWASGACLLIPRRIYETIGGFDGNIFMYMEDVDFSWRARAAGFTIRIAPRALFGHSVLDRRPSVLIEKYYYFAARYLAHKWGNTSQQSFFESVIRDRPYAAELPPLPSSAHVAALRPADCRPATFEHGFAFSPLRWC
ncbi:MAG TPA: glycosyltransferase family 2 protein [Gemmataceae bacterium]|jgi:hypothetical protein